MNLPQLFEMQAVLDADILKRHPVQSGEDRLSKKILALLVELGECLNEWRGFKFWSNRQIPREPEYNWKPSKNGESLIAEPNDYKSYPLLEEYVDCLHFILSIGLELGFENVWINEATIKRLSKENDVMANFEVLYAFTVEFGKKRTFNWYDSIFERFIVLGYSLGFTWEKIELAYYDKNKINLKRQATGY